MRTLGRPKAVCLPLRLCMLAKGRGGKCVRKRKPNARQGGRYASRMGGSVGYTNFFKLEAAQQINRLYTA